MKGNKVNKKTVVGTAVSDKMEKTIVVEQEVRKMHPIYKKFVKQHTKLMAHDHNNEAAIGDVVKIVEIRPKSKKKSWKLVETIEKAQRG